MSKTFEGLTYGDAIDPHANSGRPGLGFAVNIVPQVSQFEFSVYHLKT